MELQLWLLVCLVWLLLMLCAICCIKVCRPEQGKKQQGRPALV